MKILVTGGAGYIGHITSLQLIESGHDVVIFDHFKNHNPSSLESIPFIKGDVTNFNEIKSALESTRPDAVMHFAAFIQMGESVANPRIYYENNVLGSLNLANAMVETGVDKIVFSSTAGVYGNPDSLPIKEDAKQRPTNPYGETKLSVERMLRWYEVPYGLRSISIRYFNASGATLDGKFGEEHEPESHIIPNIIRAQLENKPFELFGSDYPTPDGTCVRDYIHILDLANAHMLALDALSGSASSNYYNAGTGKGYSNREIIKMVEEVSGKPVEIKNSPRRPGDANELVADVTKIKSELGFEPTHSDLKTIVESAYKFHAAHVSR